MAHRLVTAAMVVLFWVITALFFVVVDDLPIKLAAIVACSFAYTKSRGSITMDHALLAGAAWFAFNIIADLSTTCAFELTGPSSRPMLRSVLFFTWVAAPTLFARVDTLRNR